MFRNDLREHEISFQFQGQSKLISVQLQTRSKNYAEKGKNRTVRLKFKWVGCGEVAF